MTAPSIVVVSTAFDCPEAARRCVESVAREGVPHVIVCADRETQAAAYGEMHANGSAPRSRLAVFSAQGQIANFLHACSFVRDPATVIVWLDGDDELAPGAIERVRREYAANDPWITYGSFVTREGSGGLSRHFGTRYFVPHTHHLKDGTTCTSMGVRSQAWRAAHLRTFRAGLLAAVPDGVFRRASGEYFTTCVDRAVMLPLLELAGERYSVIQDPICIYNQEHDKSCTHAHRDLEARDRTEIHAMTPLRPLERAPW